MSKPRLKLYTEVDTLLHANTIKTNIQTQLVGKDIFETHSLASGLVSKTGKNVVYGDWRFNTQLDRDFIRNWIKDQIETHPQVKNWVKKARLSWHVCSHDDPIVVDCTTTSYAEFVK